MPCFRYFLLPFLCLGLTACSNTGSVSSASMMPDYPDIITVERGGFTPEGIEYDHLNQRFLLGSFIEGKVFALAANGELTTVVDDPDVDAIIGIEVEEDRQRILAAVADPGSLPDRPVALPGSGYSTSLVVQDLPWYHWMMPTLMPLRTRAFFPMIWWPIALVIFT